MEIITLCPILFKRFLRHTSINNWYIVIPLINNKNMNLYIVCYIIHVNAAQIKWFWKHTKWKTSYVQRKIWTKKMDRTIFTTKCRTKVYNIGFVDRRGCLPTLGGKEDRRWWYMYMYEFKHPYFTLHWQFKRFTIFL